MQQNTRSSQEDMPPKGHDNSENSYRSILKGTSLFGGVQIFQILINLIRGKFVAILLGPAGMGINSLFTSTNNALVQASSLGLNLAYSKEVASARSEDPSRLNSVVSSAIHAMRGASLLGALFCILFSGWLSEFTFGSREYAWQFMMLAVGVLLSVSANGKLAILQGLHRVRILSKASLVGGLTGLLGGVPLYYFFGRQGIVPAIVLLALTTWIFYTFALRRAITDRREAFSRRSHWPAIRRMLALGVVMMATTLAATAAIYLLNVIIRALGSVDDVGLFGAANSITNQYSSVVFAAMSMDYFPRLAAIASDKKKMSEIACRQLEIVGLLIAPAALLLIVTAPGVIRLLLSEAFMQTESLMRWMAVGIMLKALSFPLGYMSFARGDKRFFFWLEGMFANILFLTCSAGGYALCGLIGLGYGMVVENLICLSVYCIVTRKRYGFRFSSSALSESGAAVLLTVAGFILAMLLPTFWSYIGSGAVLLIAIGRNFGKLRQLISKR